jgi:hypothetical protein
VASCMDVILISPEFLSNSPRSPRNTVLRDKIENLVLLETFGKHSSHDHYSFTAFES